MRDTVKLIWSPYAMNIRKFAEQCGVSPSTVSRALGRSPEKSELSREMYDRIRAKAAELGFRPNFHAQAMLSRRSNSIGFIAGYDMPLVCGSILEGLAQVLTPQEKNLTVHPCRNRLEEEATAFEKMIYFGVDAIIHFPCMQPHGRHTTEHLKRMIARNPEMPPVISLFPGTDIPSFFQQRFRERETGRKAALQQLQLGCRRFGLLDTELTMLRNLEIAKGYRDALLANGVPRSEIIEVNLNPPVQDISALSGIDGLFCTHLLVLPGLLPKLSRVCCIDRLHVNATCSEENRQMLHWLLPDRTGELPGELPFQTLRLHLYSLNRIGIKAAELALKAAENSSQPPSTEYFELEEAPAEALRPAELLR